MNNRPKVSVVVPIYKVEAFMERCARSLFEQTLDDIEYLFIDDASPDRSVEILLRILEEYPHRKKQVKIHHMDRNSGQAIVRQWGIQNSSGEYIIHCDSDDWVEKDAYESLYLYAISNKCDIVLHDYFMSDGAEKKVVNLNFPDVEKKSVISTIISGAERGSLCMALVKREIYFKEEMLFPVGDMTEDSTLLIQMLWLADNIKHLPKPYYNYYRNASSTTNSLSVASCEKKFKDCCNNTTLIEEFLNEHCCTLFKEDILIRKLLNINLLLPVIYKFSCYLKWRYTYPNIFSQILRLRRISWGVKVKIILAYCGFYPIYHFLKGYKFAK